MKRSVYLEPARRLRRMFDGWRSAGAAAGRRAGRLIVSVCRIEAKTPLLTLLTLHYTHSWKDAIRKSKTSADGCRDRRRSPRAGWHRRHRQPGGRRLSEYSDTVTTITGSAPRRCEYARLRTLRPGRPTTVAHTAHDTAPAILPPWSGATFVEAVIQGLSDSRERGSERRRASRYALSSGRMRLYARVLC